MSLSAPAAPQAEDPRFRSGETARPPQKPRPPLGMAFSHFDLAIVAAILAAQRIFRADELRRTVLLGELGLDGRVRPVGR